MTVAFIIAALALIAVGVAAFALVAKRSAQRPVPAIAGQRVTGLAAYHDVLGSSTGDVEVIAPTATFVATSPEPVGSAPLFDLDREPAVNTPVPEIRWCKGFDPRSGALDDVARLRLIGDLGVVAKEWCVPLLSGAYEQEPRSANRQAALIALAACRSRTAAATFRLALASGDAHERAIASDALSDLEPPPKTKPRTFVERR